MIKRIIKRIIYRLFLLTNGIKKNELIVLATISKTGTHYLRFILAHYLSLSNGGRIDENDLSVVDRAFPNSWHVHYFFRKKLVISKYLKNLNYYDMPRSHYAYQNEFFGSKVIHTYRNPLDYFVILWMIKYRYDPTTRDKYSHPFELIDEHIQDYCNQYMSMRNSTGKDIFRISFEYLIRNPVSVTTQILIWLGHNNPDKKNLIKAIDVSNLIPSAKIGASEKWQRNGSKPCNEREHNDFMLDLEKNGSIGVWKKYFTNDQVRVIELKLMNYDVDLNQFTLE